MTTDPLTPEERERKDLTALVDGAIRHRLKWASLHWQTHVVAGEAWSHLADAVVDALLAARAQAAPLTAEAIAGLLAEHRLREDRAAFVCDCGYSCLVPDMHAAHQAEVIARAQTTAAPHPTPGPCWDDSPLIWPMERRAQCNLLAGHPGAHTDGSATWRHGAQATVAPTSGPGWFWTQDEWAEWSNELALLIPEDDMAGNPDGAQESIILNTLAMYVRDRAAAADDEDDSLGCVCAPGDQDVCGHPACITAATRADTASEALRPAANDLYGDAGPEHPLSTRTWLLDRADRIERAALGGDPDDRQEQPDLPGRCGDPTCGEEHP